LPLNLPAGRQSPPQFSPDAVWHPGSIRTRESGALFF
jgi:hypothetical protein